MVIIMYVACSLGGSNVDPDNRDESPVLPVMKSVSEFIGKFFKGVATNPSIHEPCLYTVSSFTVIVLCFCILFGNIDMSLSN